MRSLWVMFAALLIGVLPIHAQDDTLSYLGWLIPYATLEPPTGCLPANGTTYARVDYPEIYAALDLAFIVDADTFATPDLRGRAVIGAGEGTGLTIRAVNETGGAETHVLTEAEMPAHSHTVTDPGHTHDVGIYGLGGSGGYNFAVQPDSYAIYASPQVSTSSPTGITIDPTGAGDPHNTMMPFLAINYCMIAVPADVYAPGGTVITSEMGDGQAVAFDYTVTAGDVGNFMVLGFIAMFSSLQFLKRNETAAP
jgi:microcystin-dependent protein